MADQDRFVDDDGTAYAAVNAPGLALSGLSKHVCTGCAAYLGDFRRDSRLCARLPECAAVKRILRQ